MSFLKSSFLIFFCFNFCLNLVSQDVSVQGKLKISDVEKSNSSDSVLVRLMDGTIALRDQSTLNSGCGLNIGDTYQGGIIFYLDGSGCHGLIADLIDLPASFWSSSDIDVNSISDWVYGGEFNTKRIVEKHILTQDAPAAQVCYNSTKQGYTDWYLPSFIELNMMFVNLKQEGVGSFVDGFYWSSSSSMITNAIAQRFSDGHFENHDKNFYQDSVRAIRSF